MYTGKKFNKINEHIVHLIQRYTSSVPKNRQIDFDQLLLKMAEYCGALY